MAEPSMLLAMILLTAGTTPPAEQVQTELQAHGLATARADTTEKGGLTIGVDGGFVVAAAMPGPIPEPALADLAATNEFWEGGAAAVRDHGAHLVVVGKGLGDGLDGRVRFTRALGAIAQAADAVGVYWGDGSSVWPTKLWSEFSKAGTAETPPLPLWVGRSVARDRAGRVSLLTRGMQALGASDVHVVLRDEAEVNEAWAFMLDLCNYVLTSGRTISQGDTVGESGIHKLKVKYRRSPVKGEKGKVLWFEY